MPDRPPRAPNTPTTPTTSSRPHLLRPSTIAASAKRAILQRPKRAKPKRTTQQTKKTASSILTTKYVESSASKEEEKEQEKEQEKEKENAPSRGEFTLNSRIFRRATNFASRRKRKKTSHIWNKDKGFEIIDVKTGSRHYYCIKCCNKEKDEYYTPFAVKGTSNIIDHWKKKHGIDNKGKPVQISSRDASDSLISIFDFKI
jgi:hypothetical protein